MKKKSPKKNEPTPEYDPLRQQNVLLEDIRKKVKTVAEGHSGIVRDINDIKDTLNEHKVRFDRIEAVVIENRKDIKELKTGQEELKAGQEDLKTDTTHLKSDVKKIEQKLDTVTQDHEQRIQKLETAH